jgi:hypothetical protein
MDEWGYAQEDPAEQLARLHYFSIMKLQDGAAIEFIITVKEYVTPPLGALRFFAQASRQTNQKVAPYTPCGWGSTLSEAVGACTREIKRFRDEG